MDEHQFTSLTDTQSTTATAPATLADSTYLTYYNLEDADVIAAVVMTNDVAEPQPLSPPDATS